MGMSNNYASQEDSEKHACVKESSVHPQPCPLVALWWFGVCFRPENKSSQCLRRERENETLCEVPNKAK